MRVRFYLIVILVLVTAAMLVDAVLGKLYIRYMILFSGAVFLWGMVVGQRSEQAWIRLRDRLSRRGRGSVPRRARVTGEVAK
jgi:hypothetical protein